VNTDDDSHSHDGGRGKLKVKKSAIIIFLTAELSNVLGDAYPMRVMIRRKRKVNLLLRRE